MQIVTLARKQRRPGAAQSSRRTPSPILLQALMLFAAWLIAAEPALAASTVTSYRAEVQPRGAPRVNLHVEERGRGSPILLLHGLGASTYSWRHVAPRLARSHRVIALDLRGFGRSDKPFDQRYSPGDQALHVIDFIRRRKLSGMTLVGHSFGGAVALLVTLELNRIAPGTIRRLVLLDAPAYPQAPTRFVSFLRQPVLPYALLTLLPPELPTSFALSNEKKSGTMSMADVSAYAAPYYEASARHALISTARQLRPSNWRRVVKAYRTIRQPTLIVWCDHDDVVPIESGVRLSKAMPNARLHVVRACEHSPQAEQPDQVLKLFRSFLK